jgi:hypothetical protein
MSRDQQEVFRANLHAGAVDFREAGTGLAEDEDMFLRSQATGPVVTGGLGETADVRHGEGTQERFQAGLFSQPCGNHPIYFAGESVGLA